MRDSRSAVRRCALLSLALGLALAACASPVSTIHADPMVVRRQLARSAVTSGEMSWASRNVLLENGLFDTFTKQPDVALAELHRKMVAARGDERLLFALAELSFLHAQQSPSRREHALAAAVYAWAFLFPGGSGAVPGRFDPRLRVAADLYNWALAIGLASDDGSEVAPRGGTFELPFGRMDVAFDADDMRAGDRELVRFKPVAGLEVRGLAMRYRWPGLGAPLAASTRALTDAAPGADMVAPRLQVPVTALLRIARARQALVQGEPLTATLELHLPWDTESVTIAGEQVPIENEPTAAMALTFTGAPIMEVELFGFLGRLTGALRNRPPLISTTPYRPGLIPVVFVHGTASSVVRWLEMYNRLQADPDIREHYQFWFFQYDSGNPIALSALYLRDALASAVARLDPEGRDPALRRMVLIGHSQGGLLAKMQVIDSGDHLWTAASRIPLSELRLSDETRADLRRALFVKPLPEVSRVVFIATPHRGSFVAGRRFVGNVVRRLLSAPVRLTQLQAELARNEDMGGPPLVPSAVDNMSPRHHFIRTLQTIPVAPGVKVHSIIAVKGNGPVETGDDGVVKYASAHIEPVESELVVRSPHSCQSNPATIEEVRRILHVHMAQN